MSRHPLLWLTLAFVGGLAAAAWPLLAGGGSLSLGPALIAGLVSMSLIAMLLTAAEVATAPRVVALMSLCMPLVVLVRVVRDTVADPTIGNDWITGAVLLSASAIAALLLGIALGLLLRRPAI